MLNIQKPQHEQDIVVQISAKGLSEGKFSELATKIQLFLSQETEAYFSETVTRQGTIKKIFTDEGYETSTSFYHPISSASKNGFEPFSFVPVNNHPTTSNLGPRKMPVTIPSPQKQLKTGNDDDIMQQDLQEESKVVDKKAENGNIMNIETSVEISDDEENLEVEVKSPSVQEEEEDNDYCEEVASPELDGSLNLKELLDQVKKTRKDRIEESDSGKNRSRVSSDKKGLKGEEVLSKKSYKEDAVDRVFNPSLKRQTQESSQSGLITAEIIISDNDWAFEDTYFSPVDQSLNKDNREIIHSSSSSDSKKIHSKSNSSDKEDSRKKKISEPESFVVEVEEIQTKIGVQDSTNENSPLADDCIIECNDPKHDDIMDRYLRRSKLILKPTEKLVGQYDHPERGSILIDE